MISFNLVLRLTDSKEVSYLQIEFAFRAGLLHLSRNKRHRYSPRPLRKAALTRDCVAMYPLRLRTPILDKDAC